jgi:hypothetical protein
MPAAIVAVVPAPRARVPAAIGAATVAITAATVVVTTTAPDSYPDTNADARSAAEVRAANDMAATGKAATATAIVTTATTTTVTASRERRAWHYEERRNERDKFPLGHEL